MNEIKQSANEHQPAGLEPESSVPEPTLPAPELSPSMPESLPSAAESLPPGRSLALAREQTGQSLAEVAKALMLSPSQVAALEADNYGKLPGAVFVRGFVRNYARLLGLDPEPLLSRLEPMQTAPATLNPLPQSQDILPEMGQRQRPFLLWAGLALLVALLVLLMFELGWLQRLVRAPQQAPAPAPAAQPVPQPAAQPAPSPARTVVTVPLPDLASQPDAPAPASVPAQTGPVPLPAAVQPAAAASTNAVELRLVFERKSWAEVRDRDQRVLFSKTSPAGAVQTIQGQPPLLLLIGQASAVKASFRGKAVDLAPHTKNEVARLTLE